MLAMKCQEHQTMAAAKKQRCSPGGTNSLSCMLPQTMPSESATGLPVLAPLQTVSQKQEAFFFFFGFPVRLPGRGAVTHTTPSLQDIQLTNSSSPPPPSGSYSQSCVYRPSAWMEPFALASSSPVLQIHGSLRLLSKFKQFNPLGRQMFWVPACMMRASI